ERGVDRGTSAHDRSTDRGEEGARGRRCWRWAAGGNGRDVLALPWEEGWKGSRKKRLLFFLGWLIAPTRTTERVRVVSGRDASLSVHYLGTLLARFMVQATACVLNAI